MLDNEEYWFIYILKCRMFVKVGRAKDARSRLIDLQIGNPFPIEIAKEYGVRKDLAVSAENLAHDFMRKHAHSGEWFRCSVEKAIPHVERAIQTVTGKPHLYVMPKRRPARKPAQAQRTFSQSPVARAVSD